MRIYTRPKDYDHIAEMRITLERNGSMTLANIAEQLGERCTCHVSQRFSIHLHKSIVLQVIDPTNWKPVHMYSPGILEAGDVRRLKGTAEGYLRVVFQ